MQGLIYKTDLRVKPLQVHEVTSETSQENIKTLLKTKRSCRVTHPVLTEQTGPWDEITDCISAGSDM